MRMLLIYFFFFVHLLYKPGSNKSEARQNQRNAHNYLYGTLAHAADRCIYVVQVTVKTPRCCFVFFALDSFFTVCVCVYVLLDHKLLA